MLAWYLCDFQGIQTTIAKKPYIFVIFQRGVWTPCLLLGLRMSYEWDKTGYTARHCCINCYVICTQCRSRSTSFSRSCLIRIYTVKRYLYYAVWFVLRFLSSFAIISLFKEEKAGCFLLSCCCLPRGVVGWSVNYDYMYH